MDQWVIVGAGSVFLCFHAVDRACGLQKDKFLKYTI